MLFRYMAAATVFLLLSGCGVDYEAVHTEPVVSGQLIGGTGANPGAIKGVHYRTATQSGFTDKDGIFRYVEGETVKFGIADVDFDPARGAPAVSPWQLAGDGRCN